MKFPVSILIACVLNGLDIIAGVTVAIKMHELKSKKLPDGLFKKIGFFLCYVLGWGLDTYGIAIGFKFTIPVLPGIIFYVCTTEIISIAENIGKLNPDILPKSILKYFGIEDKKGE